MQSTFARRPAALALLAAAAVLLAALLIAPRAEAASIYACQKKKGGALRIVTSKTKCKKTEKKLTWSTTGKSGDQRARTARTAPTAPTAPPARRRIQRPSGAYLVPVRTRISGTASASIFAEVPLGSVTVR